MMYGLLLLPLEFVFVIRIVYMRSNKKSIKPESLYKIELFIVIVSIMMETKTKNVAQN